jgi:hypothetical protein
MISICEATCSNERNFGHTMLGKHDLKSFLDMYILFLVGSRTKISTHSAWGTRRAESNLESEED